MEEVIRLETEKFLQKGRAEDFPVVDFRNGTGTWNQFAAATWNFCLAKSIVQGWINGDDNLLEAQNIPGF